MNAKCESEYESEMKLHATQKSPENCLLGCYAVCDHFYLQFAVKTHTHKHICAALHTHTHTYNLRFNCINLLRCDIKKHSVFTLLIFRLTSSHFTSKCSLLTSASVCRMPYTHLFWCSHSSTSAHFIDNTRARAHSAYTFPLVLHGIALVWHF